MPRDALPVVPADLRGLVRAMPKTEVHLHLDGSLRVDTALELCKQRRPEADFAGFTRPENADVAVGLDKMRIDEAVKLVIDALEARGQFRAG